MNVFFVIALLPLSSLWPNDIILPRRSRSTLTHKIACHLFSSSHYLTNDKSFSLVILGRNVSEITNKIHNFFSQEINLQMWSVIYWPFISGIVALEMAMIFPVSGLTHWGRVTHICVSKLTIIASDNGLSPGRCQAIFRTNAGILLIGPWGTNFSEILIDIQTFSFKKMHLKMSSAKCRLFGLGLNELTHWFHRDMVVIMN